MNYSFHKLMVINNYDSAADSNKFHRLRPARRGSSRVRNHFQLQFGMKLLPVRVS
jgi:hypothetical protein